MEKRNHYTDTEFQEVLNGTYNGNIDELHAHLERCVECRSQSEVYQIIGKVLRSERVQFTETPKVVNQAWEHVQRNRLSSSIDEIQFWSIVIACSVVVLVCLGYLISIGTSKTIVIAVIGLIGVYLFSSMKEIRLLAGNH
ncbi:MAG: hypothetical protein JNN04_14090 [Cyclobacteriaceae bacterium]|nr:hypothetical protein [Cyclobacteriaceae bacterium]